jgi:uncharacterized protein (TIGR02217 family)
MQYVDIPFPDCIAFGAQSDPMWSTEVVANQAGFERANQNWSQTRHAYDVSFAVRDNTDYLLVRTHFHQVRGRAKSFPFKDFLDHQVAQAEGVLTLVDGAVNVFQLHKRYGSGSEAFDRKITRPMGAPVPVVYRGGVPAVAGGGAGQYALDASTGQVTFNADQSRAINSHTVGADHQVTLSSAFSPQPVVGAQVAFSGVTGTAAAVLNGKLHQITAVSGADVTVGTDTTGLTANGGTAALYVQASALAWSGQFWVPCRYDVDRLPGVAVNRQGGQGELLVQCDAIPILEVRE